MQNPPAPLSISGPVMIFVLGPPCAGKSTLCTTLSHRYGFEHFSIGNELRELISPHPAGTAALVKSTLSHDEISTFEERMRANALGPPELTAKYVKERLFGVGARPGQLRVLVDGFPRDGARWACFKDAVKDFWSLGPPLGVHEDREGSLEMLGQAGMGGSNSVRQRTYLIALKNDRDDARKRSVSRGRPLDEFDKRFDEWEATFKEVEETMRRDMTDCMVSPLPKEYRAGEMVECVVDLLRSWEVLGERSGAT